MKHALAYIAFLTLSLLGPVATAQVQDILTTRYENGQLRVMTKDKVWRDATPLQPILTLITDASSGTASLNQRMTTLTTSYGNFTTATNNALAQKANLAGGNAWTGDQSVNGNISQPFENVAHSIGNNRDVGFTKKLGTSGMLTYGSATNLIIGQSSGSTIDASNTFTNRLLLGSDGKLSLPTGGIDFNGSLRGLTADNTAITLLNDNMGLIKKAGDSSPALGVGNDQALRFVRLSTNTFSGNVGSATATELLRIQPTTNFMGVGIANPSALLHVNGTFRSEGLATFQARLDLNNHLRQYSDNSVITLKDDKVGLVKKSGQAGAFGVSSDSDMRFIRLNAPTLSDGVSTTTTTDLMTINTAGNVGIGTTTPTDKLHVVGNVYATGNMKVNGELQFPQMVTANRKVVLYDAGSDHQFYGFGVNAAMMRYQVDATSSNHVWFAGSGTTASNELMRMTGSGKLGLGTAAPNYPLHLVSSNPPSGVLAAFENGFNATGRQGAKIQFHQVGISVWRMGIDASDTQDAFVINGFGGGTYPEFLRINSAGNFGIGTSSINYRLDLAAANPALGVVSQLTNTATTSRTGVRQRFTQNGIATWDIGQPAETDAFAIYGFGGGTIPEYLRINSTGNTGIGTTNPTSRLHTNGAAGYNQLRLEKSYTPTSTSDTNGNVGDIAWDTSYIYVKTSAGWKRSALTTF